MFNVFFKILPSARLIFLLLFLSCSFMIGVALYMEHMMGLEPCPLCILQRVMVIMIALIALAAAIHGPNTFGIKAYGSLVAATATLGATITGRQLWLQSLPKDEAPVCGPSLDYLLDVFPLTEVLFKVLAGDGSCAEIVWQWFGLSIPGWTMVGFIGLIGICVLQILRPNV